MKASFLVFINLFFVNFSFATETAVECSNSYRIYRLVSTSEDTVQLYSKYLSRRAESSFRKFVDEGELYLRGSNYKGWTVSDYYVIFPAAVMEVGFTSSKSFSISSEDIDNSAPVVTESYSCRKVTL